MNLQNIRLNPAIIFDSDLQQTELGSTAVKGSLTMMVTQGLSLFLGMANTIILAHLLVPTDFGIIGMAAVITNFLSMFKDAGLSMATVQKDKITFEQISTLFWINSFISILLGIIILASSPLIALFYGRPELVPVTAALSISFVLQGITIQHYALMRRHLKFTALSINSMVAQITSIVVAIIMAWFGFRYWALVGSITVNSIVMVVMAYYMCPWIPGKIQKGSGVRQMLMFGGHLTGGDFAHFFSRNLDQILIGKYIGAEALGLYSRAYNLFMMPINQIRAPLTSVAMPVMSALKNDTPRYLSYFQRLLDIMVSASLPIAVYCFIEAEFLIRILLGPQWMGAVQVFRILSVAGAFSAISGTLGIVMLSYGYSERYLKLAIATAVLTITSFIIGLPYGITGIATAYTVANFIILIPSIQYGFKNTPVNLSLFFNTIIGPVVATLTAGAIAQVLLYYWDPGIILNHLIIGTVFLMIYGFLTLIRPKTRQTALIIIHSIFK